MRGIAGRLVAEVRSQGLRAYASGRGALGFWLIALLVGIVAGQAAVIFRLAIAALQEIVYGADDMMLATQLSRLDTVWVVTVPILGGLAVGLLLWRFTPDGRARSVADVIE
ncbi:MAG: chloride channel protein, partial [Pseudomonadota bacterium]